jgi:hypothetical protein
VIGPPDDEKTIWDLSGGWNGWRCFVAKLSAWLTEPLPVSDRVRLFMACLNTGGAHGGALTQAAKLLRQVRAGQIEGIACFSAKDFALAKLLAKETGAPCREMLSHQTHYFGEFGFELLAVVPYAYWLHRQGLLERTIGGLDTRCLYYFSKNHEERPIKRSHVPITEYPVGRARLVIPLRPRGLPQNPGYAKGTPPPYRDAFRDERFTWEKETCIVSNKISDEQFSNDPEPPTNFIAPELLLQLIGLLRARYQVIYNRPRVPDIAIDHQTIHEIGDIEAVQRAFSDVVTIQELHARFPTLTFNELQLWLYSSSRRFISVLGGSPFLASYFGGINIVFARRGWELDCGAYKRWFDRFLIPVTSGRALLEAVEREFFGGG